MLTNGIGTPEKFVADANRVLKRVPSLARDVKLKASQLSLLPRKYASARALIRVSPARLSPRNRVRVSQIEYAHHSETCPRDVFSSENIQLKDVLFLLKRLKARFYYDQE